MLFDRSAHPVTDHPTSEWGTPESQHDIVLLVARLLDEAPEDIDPEENLIECGIDSIGVMRVVDSWNRNGLTVKFAELFERPTVADWWRLVSERTPRPASPAVALVTDESAPFELSPIQHAYWVGRADDQPLGGIGCHVYLEVDGYGVDPARLGRAVRAVVERHGMLRVRIHGDGTQQIRSEPDWSGPVVHDLRASGRVTAELSALRERLSHRRLDVANGEVFDVQLALLPNGATRLHIELDLLVADVLSFNIFLDDLAAAYREGPGALRPLSYSFPRYRAELAARRADAVAEDRAYWTARLPELPAAPPLPLAVEPERIARPRFRRIARWLEPAAYHRLIECARDHRVTVAMALATAFAEVLGRWSGTSRMLLNVPVFDRKALHPDVSGLIADFTNLVLLEIDLGAPGFADRVRRTQRQFQSDISHAAYSGLDVLRDLARHGDGHAGAPVVFASNLSGGDLLSGEFRDLFGELGFMVSQTPQVWLDHQLMEMDGGLYLNWDYVPELFAEGVVEGMFDAYCAVLEWLSHGDWSTSVPVELPRAQREVRGVVGATVGLESGRLLHESFFEQARRAGERPALLWDVAGELSYGALAEWALRIAGGLVARGVRPGDAVGITLPRGPEQVAAILGVLAAGAAYVPMGVDQPVARRERMCAAAGIGHVVTRQDTDDEWPQHIRLISATEPGGVPLSAPVGVGVSGSAYVIFTSGSTGQPKGVEVSHRAAVNTVEDVNERFGVSAEDRVLAVSATDFDLSVYDLFGLLSVGGSVVLVAAEDRREAPRWVELCRRHRVTVWNSVPALFEMYLIAAEAAGADRIRLVLLSGDWVGLDLPGRYRARSPHGRFVALGGATEAAIWSNAFEVDHIEPEWRSIPYGFALRNQCYRVVDGQGRDCPDWVAGELWIGGVGLAEGYRGDPVKTGEKFVWWQGRRWYRTGDMGRFWSDGTLEFLGRFDHQVKVRGHRIELGEIESALEAHPDVEHVVATTIESGGRLAVHRKLAAAITAGAAPPTTGELERWVRDRLPGHMVPERFAVIEAVPLTANGKVDRGAVAALLTRAEVADEQVAEPPRGRLEELVAELWCELLPIERATRADNFFRCGGDSLIGTRLVARLSAAGVAGAELRGLFANPTLAGFAATLDFGPEASTGFEPDPATRYEPFPVTEVQRAYLLGRRPEFTLGGIGCQFYTEFDGAGIDLARLAGAWNALIARHDMLRAIFEADNGSQRILPDVPEFTIPVVEAAGAAETAFARLRAEMSRHTFDPTRWPLFDVRAVRDGDRVRIGIGLDNLILDALSILILFNELDRLYRDPTAPLEPVGITFRDYQRHTSPAPAELAAARDYWLSRIDDLPPAPELPLAVDPARVTTPRFARKQVQIDRTSWARITERAREYELTPSALLLACYAEVLGAWSARPEMTLTLTTFHRKAGHPDVDRLLGEFTSLLLVAYRPEPGTGLAVRARELQEQMWRGLDHQSVSATWVLRELARRAGAAEVSMPVVFTSALGVLDGVAATSEFAFGEMSWSITQTPQVWLDLQVREYAEGVRVSWDYVEGLFEDGVLDRMFAAYRGALDWLATGDWAAALPLRVPQRDARPVPRVESGRLLHTGFFEWAAREPGRVALIWGDGAELCYGALADSALRVAGGLVAAGVRPGDVVGVTLSKGPGQVAAILGVLAAGATYLPVGVNQPAARRDRMLAAAGASCVVSDVFVAWPADIRVVSPTEPGGEPLSGPVEIDGSRSAYVIFTSGSTGQPKGVEVSHRAAVNTVEDIGEQFEVGAEDRVLAVSAADFDLSVYDLFGLLGVGGVLVLIDEEDRREARRWVELCRRHRVTVWNSVPALFDMYLTAAEADGSADEIRLVLLSGDWVGLDLPGRYRARSPHGRFVALGGATEAAIWSNAFEVTRVDPEWPSIPYGFALRNQCHRVVNAAGRDCPDWVPGELWIGGVGVAEGYRGDPVKTAEKFVTWQGQRWYRTGDLARFRPDGTLEFLGRLDHQVKVLGHRIEPGEIETALEADPHIGRAIVTTVGSGVHRALAVALTAARGAAAPAVDGMAALDARVEVVGTAVAADPVEAAIVEIHIAALLSDGIGDRSASADEIGTALALADDYRDLLRLWLDWLVERDVLAARSGRFSAGRRWAEVRDPATSVALVEAGGPMHAVAERLAAVTDELAQMLRGQRSALTLLEDPVLAPEALLTEHPDVVAALGRIAATVAGLAARLGRPVRVAELGARTGRAALRLLTDLDPGHVELTLLDSSPRLLDLAARRLDGLPHQVRTQAITGIVIPEELRGAFDVVLMVDALHRYPDPVDGAATAVDLLVPRGLLIGIEHRELSPIGLLTAALLERGFGGARRSPMLDGSGWAEVLTDADLTELEIAQCDGGTLLLLTARSAADRPVLRVDDVLAGLARELPAHMVPRRATVLPRLPLSANGKVDRKRVTELLGALGDGDRTGEPPRTDTERAIARLWAELLPTAEIDRYANFFALGGDSLTATHFVEAVRRGFGVELRLRQMFAEPTLAAVAEAVAAQLDESMEDGTI
ncbi:MULTISPECIES: non-ribosomal peptide synthetase [unclassified Nocardia]|uniref:non-ribosomal peptide synthetase n=1 Tax=unclassified Nocardia TaxID=2637762 RepID=UPI001CE4A559|nr:MULTISPECIES: non-ribosomal peptide synthetase [unclassified Nocardia]